jgi:hypothetical protein
MNGSKYLQLVSSLVLILSVSLACSASSLVPQLPFPTFVPTPADFGTPTGSSPMSGDWSAQTEFGKIAFRISPDGNILEAMYVETNNFTCGGYTVTTAVQTMTDPPPSVEDGGFGISVNLGDSRYSHDDIAIVGQYDEANDKFSGEWKEDAYGTICTGTWETASRPG